MEKNTVSIFRADYSLSPDDSGYVPLKYQEKKIRKGREKRNRCRRRRRRFGRGEEEGTREIEDKGGKGWRKEE